MPQPPVRRTRHGTYEIRFPGWQRDLLRSLVTQLRETLDGDVDADPSLRRLFPSAYPGDEAADEEFRRLMGSDLLEHRLRCLDVVEETADAAELDHDQMMAWLGATNDIRLVLGTRLDVSDDPDWVPTHPEGSPEDEAYRVYEFLGALLSVILDEVMT